MNEPGVTVIEEIPTAELEALLAPLGTVTEAIRLTGGMFATTYRVTLDGGERVVVKTAPVASDRLLTYEKDLLRTEALVYGLAATRPSLHMPRVLLVDLSRTILATDVLVASHLDGVALGELGEQSPASALTTQRDLGSVMARLHEITGPVFGYPQHPGLQGDTWPAAFTAMVEALLADAAAWHEPLPAADVRAALDRHHRALAEVTVPRLVHTDLWPGNLFVDPASGQVVGVIDPERALWGDPLLELAGADQMGRGPVPTGLLEGYARAGSSFGLGRPSHDVRLLLYRMYMSLVLAVEIGPRGYQGDWVAAHRAAAEANLRVALDLLLAGGDPAGPTTAG